MEVGWIANRLQGHHREEIKKFFEMKGAGFTEVVELL
jgi:translation initiation factor 1 (eIF-1/SUI1)